MQITMNNHHHHYITVDAQGLITDGWSDGPRPEKDTAGAVCINEEGEYQFRLLLAGQHSEENPPLWTMDGILLYKWDGQQVQLRTEEEIKADRLPGLKSAKLAELSAACNAVIVSGFNIELNGETAHFNLSIEDQSNIANLFRVVELDGTEFPYQADGGVCRIYTANEIAQIYIAAQTAITTQTTYHNALKAYVLSLENADDIADVSYGMALPEPYDAEVTEKMAVAQAQMEAIVPRLNG